MPPSLVVVVLVAILAVAVLGTSVVTPSEQLGVLQPRGREDLLLATHNDTIADRVLTRNRRYVVFPSGSSIQLVYCLSFRAYVPFQTLFVFGLTAGIAWQLPSQSQQVYLQRREVGRNPDREHLFNLYRSVQAFLMQYVMDKSEFKIRGLRGEECVQRTLCESSSHRVGRGTFIEEVMRVLFNLPESGDETKTIWDSARYNGTPCKSRFPRCSSILDIPVPIETKQ